MLKNLVEIFVEMIDEEYHTERNFREQIAVLYPLDVTDTDVTLLRSFVETCESGRASLDPQKPGADTQAAWKELDEYIESGAAGIFHTHPPCVFNWSDQDIKAQNGLAKAFGGRKIFHGVQAVSGEGHTVVGSLFTCCWMEHGQVFRYHYGNIPDSLHNNRLIRLPLPPQIQWNDNAYTMYAPSFYSD